ncbi:MAG: FAD-dependent oxidoreductase [archaeon]
MGNKKILIAGAGLSGLSVAYKLSQKGFNAKVIEKNNFVGGISSTFAYKDFLLDYGPHKIYTIMPEIENFIKGLLKEELLKKPKKCLVFLEGKFFNYPVRIPQLLLGINPVKSLKMGFSFLSSSLKNAKKKDDKNYSDYLSNRFGKEVYNLVFDGYANKVWGNPKEISSDLAKARISAPNLLSLIKASIFKEKKPELSAEFFYYPKKGIIQLSENLAKGIEKNKGEVILNKKISTIFWNEKTGFEYALAEANGKEEKIQADIFVSTMPLPELINSMNPKPPKKVLDAANNLKLNSLVLLYLIIKKPRALESNWIYFPEKKFLFNRISEQKGMSEFTCPKSKTALCIEFTSTKENSFEAISAEDLFGKILPDLEKIGICKKGDIEEVFIKRIPKVYPIYSLDYKENLSIILNFLDNIPNMLTVGRNGLFNYNNMDHCIDSGFKAAENIYLGKSREEWATERESFYNYKIID